MKDGEESVLDKGEESKFEIIKPMQDDDPAVKPPDEMKFPPVEVHESSQLEAIDPS